MFCCQEVNQRRSALLTQPCWTSASRRSKILAHDWVEITKNSTAWSQKLARPLIRFILHYPDTVWEPAYVAQWLKHSGCMCSSAWCAQWPEFKPQNDKIWQISTHCHSINNNNNNNLACIAPVYQSLQGRCWRGSVYGCGYSSPQNF